MKVTLDGDRDTHNRMRPLRGRQGTFDKIIENVRQVAAQGARSRSAATSTSHRSTATRRCSTSCASRTSPTASRRSTSSRSSRRRRPSSRKGSSRLTVVGAERQAARRYVHDERWCGGRRRQGRQPVRHVPLPGREDVVPPRGNAQARFPDGRRRAHGSVRDPPEARLHARPGRRALLVPGVHGRENRIHRAHRRA